MRLDSFFVKNYRGLRNAKLEHLTDVNILVGKNNSGKTSVLEAMILSGLFDDAQMMLQTLTSRYPRVSIGKIRLMFPQKEAAIHLEHVVRDEEQDVPVTITTDIVSAEKENFQQDSRNETVEKRWLMLRFEYLSAGQGDEDRRAMYRVDFTQEKGSLEMNIRKRRGSDMIERVPCQFISFSRFDRTDFLLRALDEALEQEKRRELLEVLKIFDRRVRGFEVIGEERDIMIFRDGEDTPLSLNDYGNGMYKAFYMASAAMLCENGILLIDEIETGIHREALGKLVSYLEELCKKKHIQMFVTTHSLETVDMFLAHHREEGRLDKLAVYNIRSAEEGTVIRQFSGDKLERLRNELGLDVR